MSGLPRTMKAVVTTKPQPKSMVYQDIAVPEPKAGEVLVKLKAAGICGTDLHIYKWDPWAQKRIKTPLVQGHEWAGEIAALGQGVQGLKLGDYVSGEGHIADWTCSVCRSGNPHVCRNVTILGIDRQGSFAQYMPVPAVNIWKNDPDLPLEYATIQDPLGNAVQTAWSANPAGKTVAIFGLGPIGLMAITVCKAMGAARVLAIGHKNQFRLDLAKKVGADRVLRSSDDVEGILKQETGGDGVDDVLEFSGAGLAVEQALKVVKPAGGVHLLGVFPDNLNLDVNQLVFRGTRLVGIHGRRMFQDWQLMQGLLRSRKLNLDPIITHKLKLSEFEKGFEA
ncbi:MAG TPA: L-threonine 3-dehydrogenase, partial [Candidatus Thermoplasmatota archaeon]|nr:L-threonine 3-dehydrogenase [Candidatus Thermoplasmatota archaeon]